MTIKLLAGYRKFASNTIVTLASATETALVAGGNATTDLSGGVPFNYQPPAPALITPKLVIGRDGVAIGLADSTGKIVSAFAGIAAPGAPTGLALTAIAGGVLATFTAPASAGGTPIIGYEVTLSTGQVQMGETTTVAVNAPAGTAVTATVKTINGFDKSVASAVSNSATPTGVIVPTVPGAPTISSVSGGNATVTAAYAAGSTGNSPITSYDAFLYAAGSQVAALTNVPNPVVFTVAQGVANGTAYTVKVRARNAIGTGALSAASSAVTPTSGPVTLYSEYTAGLLYGDTNNVATTDTQYPLLYTGSPIKIDSRRTKIRVQNTSAGMIDYALRAAANINYDTPNSWSQIAAGQELIVTGADASTNQVNLREHPYDITAITSNGTTVTVTCPGHPHTEGSVAAIANVVPAGYNGGFSPVHVIDANTFSYQLTATLGAATTLGVTYATGLLIPIKLETTK
jgi:hypothetical protein